MNQKEVILIKNYIRAAYPSFRDDSTGDMVWYDLLQNYEYLGILETVKKYIRTGNKFAPSIAELIQNYEIILDSFNEDILMRMETSGMFDEPKDADPEIAEWNLENRRRRTRFYLSSPEWKRPEWFNELYSQYRNEIKTKYFGGKNNEQNLIENNF